MSSASHDITVDTFEDEGIETSTPGTSYATSIASYVRDGIEENGRKYPSYGSHQYGMPVDAKEQERNDIQHAKFNLIIGDKLHLAPVPPEARKILDLGTGSGIWAIEIADEYPNTQVTGVDIAPVQPNWVPPNCGFEILDIEDSWLFGKSTFDFIHARELMLAIRNWDHIFEEAFEAIKPGGYFEVAGALPTVSSDDGSVKPGCYLKQIEEVFFEMAEKMGASAKVPVQWKSMMERAGFVDIQEHIFKMPQGVWPKDKRMKRIGAFENWSLCNGLDAYMTRGYTQVLGGNLQDLQKMIDETKKELRDPSFHSYVYYYDVYGRKP